MSIISTIKSATLASGKRMLQYLGMGKLPYTAAEYMPWGVDSAPVNNVRALTAETENRNSRVVTGYENVSQKAAPGEFRCYATDVDGNVVVDIYLRNNGTIEAGGNTNHLTQWEALNTALNSYFSSLNTAITEGVATAGGSYTPPTSPFNMDGAKTNNFKIQ